MPTQSRTDLIDDVASTVASRIHLWQSINSAWLDHLRTSEGFNIEQSQLGPLGIETAYYGIFTVAKKAQTYLTAAESEQFISSLESEPYRQIVILADNEDVTTLKATQEKPAKDLLTNFHAWFSERREAFMNGDTLNTYRLYLANSKALYHLRKDILDEHVTFITQKFNDYDIDREIVKLHAKIAL
jgi:hypothetical protein